MLNMINHTIYTLKATAAPVWAQGLVLNAYGFWALVLCYLALVLLFAGTWVATRPVPREGVAFVLLYSGLGLFTGVFGVGYYAYYFL